jgi:hypothetical protein
VTREKTEHEDKILKVNELGIVYEKSVDRDFERLLYNNQILLIDKTNESMYKSGKIIVEIDRKELWEWRRSK